MGERIGEHGQTIVRSIEELESLKIPALKKQYRELFGEESKSSRSSGSNAEGIRGWTGVRVREHRSHWTAEGLSAARPGTLLTRRHGDRQIVVNVLSDGFEYESRRYRSLSAIAREVTGTR